MREQQRERESPTKKAVNQVKISAIRQISNVLLKSLTHFLSKLLK
jgi:hypothetical protein